jgi:hypothetical protein
MRIVAAHYHVVRANQRYAFDYDPLGHVTENKKGTATMSFLYDPAEIAADEPTTTAL